jgi:succinoglycan biosynthesis transport protein ExoP
MSINAPPSARIAPIQSFIRHWRISAVVALVVILAGVPFAWFKGQSTYNAESVFMVAPAYMKNLETDKEIELQSNSQYLQFVFHLSKTVTRYDVLKKAIKSLNDKGIDLKPPAMSERRYIESLQKTTYVRSIPETYMVRIGRDDTEKEHLDKLVNAITDAFIQTTREEQIYGSSDRAESLSERQKVLLAEMAELEDERAGLAEKLNLTTFNENTKNPYDGNLRLLNEKLANATIERMKAEVALASFRKEKEVASTYQRSTLELRLQDAGLQSLRNEVIKRTAELNRLSSGLTGQHPAKSGLDAELQAITKRLSSSESDFDKLAQDNLLTRFAAAAEQTKTAEQEIHKQLSEAQALASDFARTFRRAVWITKELNKRETDYYEIRDRVNYLLSEKNAIGFVRLVTAALPPETPMGTGKFKMLLIVILVAVAVGFILPTVIEILDRNLRSVTEAEKAMGISAAGWLVRMRDYASKMKAADQMRRFSSTLIREKARHSRQVYGFTSVKLGAGVTQVVLETARTLIQLGPKVLVIDANSFKPHAGFDSFKIGLTDYLSGRAELAQVVSSFIHDGTALDVVSIGAFRASGLRRLDKFKLAMTQWSQAYDFILVDVPPLLLSADAELLIEVIGQVFLVVEIQSMTKADVVRAKSVLEKLDPEAVGLFVNSVSIGRSSSGVDPVVVESLTGKKYSQFMNVPYPLLKWEILLTRWQAWRMQRRLRQLRLKKGYNTSQ